MALRYLKSYIKEKLVVTFLLREPDGQTIFTPPMDLVIVGRKWNIYKTCGFDEHKLLGVSQDGKIAKYVSHGDTRLIYGKDNLTIIKIDVT